MNTTAPNLARMQRDWSRYFRSPRSVERPADTEPRRIDVYPQLLRSNIGGFIHQCFPICRASMPPERWEALIDQFFAEGKWHHTPFFHEIPKGFVTFLQATDEAPASGPDERSALPPWFAELAHYEWLELAVETAPDIPLNFGPQGLALGAALQLAAYAWPVQHIGPEDVEVTPATTFVAVFRNRKHQVRFSTLTPGAAQLLAILQDNGCDWQNATEQLASTWGLDVPAMAADIQPLQRQWIADELLIQRPGHSDAA